MPTKNELLQFVITNNTNDCSIDVPLLSENNPSINSRTKYTWNITSENVGCGCWNIVINGITYLNTYNGTLLGLQQGFSNLGFGFFCTQTIGADTFLYTLDDVNIYGQIETCVCPTTSTTTTTTTALLLNTNLLYYPIIGSIIGYDDAASACAANTSGVHNIRVYYYGDLELATTLYTDPSTTNPIVVDTTKYYYVAGQAVQLNSSASVYSIVTCPPITTTTTSTTTTTTTSLLPTTTTTSTTSTSTSSSTTSTTTTTTTLPQLFRYGNTSIEVCSGGGSSIAAITYISGSTICNAASITATEFYPLAAGNYVIYDSYNGWIQYNKPNGIGFNSMTRIGGGCSNCVPITTSTTTTTTTFAFIVNASLVDEYTACNLPEYTSQTLIANGSNICDSTSVVLTPLLTSDMTTDEVIYLEQRISGVFKVGTYQRVGNTNIANRIVICATCVPASTTTTTTSTTTTTTTFAFNVNASLVDEYTACNAPEYVSQPLTGNGVNICDSTYVVLPSIITSDMTTDEVIYLSMRVLGVFKVSTYQRVGNTNIANRMVLCSDCVPPSTTTTTTSTTTTTTTFAFNVNASLVDAYSACNAPDYTTQPVTGNGSNICDSTYVVLPSTITSDMTTDEVIYLEQRVLGVFNVATYQRVGNTNIANRTIVCSACVPPIIPTTTTTTTSTSSSTTSTTTTTTTFAFNVNASLVDAYNACNAPEYTSQTLSGNGSNICDSTSVVLPSSITADMTTDEVIYLSMRVLGIFNVATYQRVGNTSIANRIVVCSTCAPASTTTTTTTTTTLAPTTTTTTTTSSSTTSTTTTTTTFAFNVNASLVDAYNACNAPEYTTQPITGNSSNICDSTYVILPSTITADMSADQVIYLEQRVLGIFSVATYQRVGSTSTANRIVVCSTCAPASTTTTTSTTSSTSSTSSTTSSTSSTTSSTTSTTTQPPITYSFTSVCVGLNQTFTLNTLGGGDGTTYYASTTTYADPASAAAGATSLVSGGTRTYTSQPNGTRYIYVTSGTRSTTPSGGSICTTTTTTSTTSSSTSTSSTTTSTSSTTTTTTQAPIGYSFTAVCNGVLQNFTLNSLSGGNGTYYASTTTYADPASAAAGATSLVSGGVVSYSNQPNGTRYIYITSGTRSTVASAGSICTTTTTTSTTSTTTTAAPTLYKYLATDCNTSTVTTYSSTNGSLNGITIQTSSACYSLVITTKGTAVGSLPSYFVIASCGSCTV